MASAFGKDIARSMRASLGRFLAIAGIVALGCGFYAGLRMTGPDMRIAGDAFYDGTHLHDIRVVSTLGFTQDQLEDVAAVDGVEAAYAAKSTDVMALLGGEQYAMRVSTFDAKAATESTCTDGVNVDSGLDSYLNRLVLDRGRWPQEAGECVLSADRVMGTPIELGDEVEILYGSQDLEGVLETRTFTVCGLVHSSMYVSSTALGSTSLGSGTIQQFAFVSEETFSSDFPYTEIYLEASGAREEFSGSADYQARVDAVSARLEQMADSLAESRLGEIRDEAQAELDEKKAEYEDEKADAQAELDDARQKLDDAAQELENGRAELEDGQRQYDDGVAQLQASQGQAYSQLAAARQKLEDSEAQIASGEEQLRAAQAELDAKRGEYEAGRAAWEASYAEWEQNYQMASGGLAQAQMAYDELTAQIASLPEDDPMREMLQPQADELAAQIGELQATVSMLDEAKVQIDAGQAELDAAQVQLDEGQATIDAQSQSLEQARSQIQSGWSEYYAQEQNAQIQLANAQQELDDAAWQLEVARGDLANGEAELADGEAEYEEGKQEADEKLADAQEKIDSAQSEIDDLEPPEIYVLDRTKNYGVESYRSDSERIDNIAAVFPFIFFLVAALVALTTMTRMVDEERVTIGTYKALGYSRAKIIWKYVSYALTASASGALVGIALLSQVLPSVISKAYAIIYNVPPVPVPLPIDAELALLSAAMGVGITLVATWGAAASTLREQPARLMLPRSPKPGKRIMLQRIKPLWSRLSFSWKVTCRNLFRYKRRFWMTVAGIAGCTALLLTGLGLHDAIWDIIDKHFGPVVEYNVVVEMDEDATSEEIDDAMLYLQQSPDVSDIALALDVNLQVSSDAHGNTDIMATIPRDVGTFSHLVNFKERVGQAPIVMTDESVVLTEKMARTLQVEPGDYITVYEQDEIGNPKGSGYRLQVSDIAEYYVGHGLFVGKDAWAQAVDEPVVYSSVYGICTEDPNDREAVTESLHDMDCVETVTYNDETIDTYRKMLSSVNMIVVVLVVAAAGLAAIVLYNLSNINITERRREIASLKVLGFTRSEVNAYIFRETLLLTMIGAVLGLVFGYYLEGFVVVTAEVDYVMFGREIHILSFVVAYALTIVFSALVMLAMRGKLTGIDMVESLKSIE